MYNRNSLGSEIAANQVAVNEFELEEALQELEFEDENEALDYEDTDDNEFTDFDVANAFGEAGGGRIQNKKDPKPADLVLVEGHGGKKQLQKDAAKAWRDLVVAARADGLKHPIMLPTSGYRSSATQKGLFDQALKRYGSRDEARKWVAPPGGSAHQSGRAIDFYLGTRNSSNNLPALKRTKAFAWMQQNARRFGFYPYTREPWHWEYNPPASGVEQEFEQGSFLSSVVGGIGSMAKGMGNVAGGLVNGIFNNGFACAKLLQVANAEWLAWNKGLLVETDTAARPLLTKYWSEGVGRSPQEAANTKPGEPWSAAFVSYVMKQIYPKFGASRAHGQYVKWAKNSNGRHPFTAVRPQGAVIQIGDILVNERENSGVTFEQPNGLSHGSIVIAIDRAKNEVTVIGGNVRNRRSRGEGVTVNKDNWELTSNGKLKHPNKFHAIVRMTGGSCR